MKVTKIVFFPPQKRQSLARARVELLFGEYDVVVVDDLRVLSTAANDLWVGFPTRPIGDRFIQTVFFSSHLKNQIETAVIEAYRAHHAKLQAQQQAQPAQEGGAL
jgi:DNA-binding cell septation regulator SpoVG